MALDWHDDVILLNARHANENGYIAEVLASNHGLYRGFIRMSSKQATKNLQVGNIGVGSWRARLDNQLGTIQFETTKNPSSFLLNYPGPLQALQSACSILVRSLPEREPLANSNIYMQIHTLLMHLTKNWRHLYARWEICLLSELGYALELSHCKLTGQKDNLVYVSPKSGHAISKNAAGEYAPRMLALPSFLLQDSCDFEVTYHEFLQSLQLSGHFLQLYIKRSYTNPNFPQARNMLQSYAQMHSLKKENSKTQNCSAKS